MPQTDLVLGAERREFTPAGYGLVEVVIRIDERPVDLEFLTESEALAIIEHLVGKGWKPA
jgi:hypothetical protein